ncbi:MAG: phosphoribosyltransferase family protein [Infirmifilum sp.]
MSGPRVEDHIARVICHRALRAVRAYIAPREIIEVLGEAGVEVSPVDLSRYLSGSVLPTAEKAYQILRGIYTQGLVERVFRKAVEVDPQGVVNVPLIAYNLDLVQLASSVAFLLFRGKVDVVVTAATNGVPLASLVASSLGARLGVARRERESPSLKYLETGVFLQDPPSYVHLYLPADALKRGDRVLIADDLFRTGRTLKALFNMVDEARGVPVAGFSMVAVGDTWREVAPEGLELVTLLQI